jgi:hypothetical protein
MDDALAAAAAAGAAAATTIAAIPATGQAAVAAAVNPNPDPSRGGDVAATRELSPRAPRQARAGPGPVGEASRLAEAAQLGEPTRRPGFGTLPTDPPWEGVPVRGPVVRRPVVALPPDLLSDEDGNEPPPTDSDLDDAAVAGPPDVPTGPARSALLDERHPTRRSRWVAPRGAEALDDDADADAATAATADAATAGAAAGAARAAAGRPSTRGAAAAAPNADDGANATTGRRVRRRTGGDS